MAYIDELKELNQKDARKGFNDFYQVFDYYTIYSKSAMDYIVGGKRGSSEEINHLLKKSVEIYREHTVDYQKKYLDPQVLNEMIEQHNVDSLDYVSPERLESYVNSDNLTIRRALKHGKNNKICNNIYDTLQYDFVHERRSIDHYFENVTALHEIDRALMRAELHDGINFLSIADIAQETGIAIDDLKNLAKVCHSHTKYEEIYQKLVELQEEYQV